MGKVLPVACVCSPYALLPRDVELEKKAKTFHFATVMLLFVDKQTSDSMAMEWGLDLSVVICS